MCLCRGWWLSRGGWWWLSCVHLVQILFCLWYTLCLYLDWFWQLVGYRGLLHGHSYLGLHGVYGEGSSSSLVSVDDVYHGVAPVDDPPLHGILFLECLYPFVALCHLLLKGLVLCLQAPLSL